MNISRPDITIVPSTSGKKFAIEWTSPSWTNKYQHLQTFDTEKDATAFKKEFAKDFNDEAIDIENGVIPRHHIPTTLVDNGIARGKRKVTAGRFGA